MSSNDVAKIILIVCGLLLIAAIFGAIWSSPMEKQVKYVKCYDAEYNEILNQTCKEEFGGQSIENRYINSIMAFIAVCAMIIFLYLAIDDDLI